MSNPNPGRSELDISVEIDRICDEFESQYRDNMAPKIEDYLQKLEPDLRPRLFIHLLSLELEFTPSKPVLAEYVSRFPDLTNQVESVFEEMDLLDWAYSSIGPFEILSEIARGGMGVVYLAHDSRLDRKVAIKILTRKRRTDSRWLRRFRREARLASGLNHPNILTVYEIGEEKQTPYIATEFVEGETLRQIMAGQQLPLQLAMDYAYQISNGMVAAHKAEIIHRDLKADNIMIRDDGLVKILDFGLAKIDSDSLGNQSILSKTGAIKGTIHFMSPEQARGQRTSSSTDVFSFGVIIYLMVSGKLPFAGQSVSDVLANILNSEPTAFKVLGITIPIQLESLIFKCLQKTAELRPTFEEIASAIDTIRREVEPDKQVKTFATADSAALLPQASTLDPELTLASDADHLTPSAIRYAQSGDLNIAWQEIGDGPIDIVFVMGWVSHLEWFWKDQRFSSFLRRLATFARVILFDKRGTGLSDKVPVHELPNLETRMDDVRAVMEAAKSQQAVLCGVSEGGPLCALFAATYPDKTLAITMIGSYSRRLWAEDYPWGPTSEERELFLKEIQENWGGPLGVEDRAPSLAEDQHFREWWASYLRMGASPGAAVALTKMNAQIDIRPILSSIHVPTLVIHRSGDRCLLVDEGRHLADQIPGAKFVELPGIDHLPFVGDAESILSEIEYFLAGISKGSNFDCVLATVLCILVKPSSPDVDQKFEELVRREIKLFRGQNFLRSEDSIFVTFDGPVRSVLCATRINQLAKRLNIQIQCGLETGTCNIDQKTIYGPAVDGSRRVAQTAQDSTIVLTSSLRNLISGSDFAFEPIDNASESDSDISLFQIQA